MMGRLTIYSTGGKGEPLTLRDVVNMIESLGGTVSFAEAGTVDFDLDAQIEAKISVNNTTIDSVRLISLSFRVSGTDG